MGKHKDKDKSKKKSKSKDRSRDKDRSKDKKRRRDDSSSDSSSSSDSDDGRKRQKSEKLAQKVVAHLQKTSAKGGSDQPFVWGKKVEKELAQGKKLKDISVFSDRNRQQERLDELEKVRKRQAEREAEKARREEELTLVQRMRAAQEAMESEAKEEEFYLQNLLSKAERRLREGRPAPSDLIARNLHAGLRLGEPADVDMKEPWSYFTGLQLDDVEALHHDIKEYAEYDKYDPLHAEFWKALLKVADHELAEARKRDAIDRAHITKGAAAAAALAAAAEGEQTAGLHSDVEADIHNMLSGQSYGELNTLETNVQASLASGEGDPEYWTAVLQRLQIYKAKAHVREIQSRIVSATLQRLAQEAAEAAEELGLDSEEEEETDYEEDEEEGGEGGGGKDGKQQGAGTGAAAGGSRGTVPGGGDVVGRAMGWAKEDRGVVRAAGAVSGEGEQAGGEGGVAGGAGTSERAPPAPANPEEISLDDDEEGGAQGAGHPAADGGEGGEAGPSRGAGGAAAVGPEPANVVFPSEIPVHFRRGPRRRRRRGQEGDQGEEVVRVGGAADELPDEVIADGTKSPVPVDPRTLKAGAEVVGEEDDYRELELLRQSVMLQTQAKLREARARLGDDTSTADRTVRSLLRDAGRIAVHPMNRNVAAIATEGPEGAPLGFRSGIPDTMTADEEQVLAAFRSQSAKLMGSDGADRDFGGEVPLEAQVYWWHDKYKPRKPKYFNRVHTGYEWNKYNQTHYDYDNPPPKVVQGYKFNILYHDLIDKTQAPQYVLEPDPQSTDNSTCMIRFIAGAPYEDIAFRIVNKEWNYARKHGFRCSFERGILHLFFNFKRARYRR